MICDECREETGKFHARTEDGRVLCYKCARTEKRPKREKADAFRAMAQKLRKVPDRDYWPPIEVIAVNRAGKRCYTNASILITESESFQLLEVDTIDVKDGKRGYGDYPNIKNVLKNRPGREHVVQVPDEFYAVLQAFDLKAAGRTHVHFGKDAIEVRGANSDESAMTLIYGGADTSKVGETTTIDAYYLDVLRPKKVRLGETHASQCEFEGCKIDLKRAVVMPIGRSADA